MISVVFWALYAGVCIGAGWVAWAGSKNDGDPTAECVWAAVWTALFAPVIIGLVAAVLILSPVYRS